ncbi:DUF2180 family protein [Streptomyces sp. HNA39]|uniref:DUF2180 family protein n=1 Tax=Streptomyces sp. HNA39 TaxID=2850561 RepID=UPI00200E907A|nr:DUF2180 family protein [Streptomyces sp. HNA39]UQA38311.1 DUF2180 family protein [Streptomyces sp. HNA39]
MPVVDRSVAEQRRWDGRSGLEDFVNCYECRREGRVAASAEAVCEHCGAGVCADRVRVEMQELHQQAGLGKRTRNLPARRMLCTVCEAAERSG